MFRPYDETTPARVTWSVKFQQARFQNQVSFRGPAASRILAAFIVG